MNSKLSTKQVLSALDELSQNNLHFRDDVERLIDISIQHEMIPALEKLSFTAKFSSGLLRVVQKKDSAVDEQYFVKAADEYKESILKVRSMLEELLAGAGEFIKSIFTEKYLQMTQTSLSNLNALCSDLGYLKLFFNDQKFSKNLYNQIS